MFPFRSVVSIACGLHECSNTVAYTNIYVTKQLLRSIKKYSNLRYLVSHPTRAGIVCKSNWRWGQNYHYKYQQSFHGVLSLLEKGGLPLTVTIQPPRGWRTDITYRVNRAGWDEELFTYFWMADLTIDLELHLTVKYKHEFIRAMNEIFPALPRLIQP